ncbi:MAG: hypothetical protein ACFE8P_06580 [Promethearchaeota archaeon]
MTEVKKRIVDLNVEEIPTIEEEDESKLKEEIAEKKEERSIWDYFSDYPYISTIFFF